MDEDSDLRRTVLGRSHVRRVMQWLREGHYTVTSRADPTGVLQTVYMRTPPGAPEVVIVQYKPP